MVDIPKYSELGDYYINFLSPKQLEVYELYFLENYSLQEIADFKKTSRNNVYLNIKRIQKLFEECERKLGLVAKLAIIKSKLDEESYQVVNDIIGGSYGI
jgi:predicted DNA-binding protein YlxM (UPF0122 family)